MFSTFVAGFFPRIFWIILFSSELLEHDRKAFVIVIFIVLNFYSMLSKLDLIDEKLSFRYFSQNKQFHLRNDYENFIILYVIFLLNHVVFDIESGDKKHGFEVILCDAMVDGVVS